MEQRLSWKLAFGKLAFGKLAFGKLAAGVLAALLVLAALPAAAASQSPTRSIEAMRERINAGTVGIVSGGLNGTYIRIAAELAAVLDDGDTLRVLPLVGKGSVQNIADILFLKGIDIGIVQSDVLAYIRRERLYPGADKSIQYIAKLYNEEVHILAARDIARVEDLAGKKVNFDVANSGTAMTASLIFERLKTAVEPVHDDQALASTSCGAAKSRRWPMSPASRPRSSATSSRRRGCISSPCRSTPRSSRRTCRRSSRMPITPRWCPKAPSSIRWRSAPSWRSTTGRRAATATAR